MKYKKFDEYTRRSLLCYYNDLLLKKGLITSEEYWKMQAKILESTGAYTPSKTVYHRVICQRTKAQGVESEL